MEICIAAISGNPFKRRNNTKYNKIRSLCVSEDDPYWEKSLFVLLVVVQGIISTLVARKLTRK